MENILSPSPSFNLWSEPWITVERHKSPPLRVSLAQALLSANQYAAIYDTSPLVVVGIHRLLTAILQAIINPKTLVDLSRVWQAGEFPADQILKFGEQFALRFDLFSESAPYLQSADLPLQPARGDKIKTVAYLLPDAPSGTEIIHYRHLIEDEQVLCPACAAQGLTIIPCFATSGGAGIKPSINGVPPIYIFPVGKSLFESLALSLLLPGIQPKAASLDKDLPWWERSPVVHRGEEVYIVGYLASLTFPARRVRLHPESLNASCTRCGQTSQWMIRTMIFEMGECRPKEAAFWQDPFAAYNLPGSKSTKPPSPIRPVVGKALWREYASLFLPQSEREEKETYTLRPNMLTQLANLPVSLYVPNISIRCVGVRTDMKAKIFEWFDATFEVPFILLNDEDGGRLVRDATQFAQECEGAIREAFRKFIGKASKNRERHKEIQQRMKAGYWGGLATPFRQLVLDLADGGGRYEKVRNWTETVKRQARLYFEQAAESIGDDATSLRDQAKGKQCCNNLLAIRAKKFLEDYSIEGANQ